MDSTGRGMALVTGLLLLLMLAGLAIGNVPMIGTGAVFSFFMALSTYWWTHPPKGPYHDPSQSLASWANDPNNPAFWMAAEYSLDLERKNRDYAKA